MFGQYGGFIVPAYLITGFSLLAMTAYIAFNYKRKKQQLADMEESSDQ